MAMSEWEKVKETYFNNIKDGPTFICVCCGRLWFKSSLKSISKDLLVEKGCSEEYISSVFYLNITENNTFCYNCYKDVIKRQIPKLCLKNGLDFPVIPDCLNSLTRLEERNVAARIPFMCIRALGVDRQCGLKGSVINVPNPIDRTVSMLPRNFSETFTILLKLKRRMAYDRHYMCETVCPKKIFDAAQYLVGQELYVNEGITLSQDWMERSDDDVTGVSNALHLNEENLSQSDHNDDANITDGQMVNDNYSHDDDPSVVHASGESQTNDINDFEDELEPINPGGEETLLDSEQPLGLVFAPGEGQRPLSLLLDKYAEELAFPTIYCGKIRRALVPLSYTDICNSEIRRYDRRAARTDHLLYAYKKNELSKIASAIGIALKKKKGHNAQRVKNLLDKDEVNNLIQADDGYRFLRNIRNAPAHWEAEKKKLLAMVRQFGLPTFFVTLSAAETKWPQLLRILAEVVDKRVITDEEAINLSYEEKVRLIRSDAVTCALYFNHSFKELMKTWKCTDGPFGNLNIEHYYYRIEFQHRGSPHVHMLLWLERAPAFNPDDEESIPAIESFVDNIITCSTNYPPESDMTELLPLQKHRHTHTCKKNVKRQTPTCRFGIPYFPMDRTRVLFPLDDDECETAQRKAFKEKLDTVKKHLSDMPTQTKSFEEFLHLLDLTLDDYLLVVRSSLEKPKIFLKREVSELWMNPYNNKVLTLHRANMDIQFVLDPYACACYIVDYINKSNRGMSKLLREALAGSREDNTSLRKKLRVVANQFINASEISAQEAAWSLLHQHMSEASEAEVFISTGPPDERIRIVKSDEELRQLDPESTEVCVSGLIEHYVQRPDLLEDMCLAQFAAWFNFYKKKSLTTPTFGNNGSEVEDVETNVLPLKDKSGYLRKRRKAKVIRYRRYTISDDADNFYRELLMLFLPWRSEETELLTVNCKEKFDAQKVQILERRKEFVFNENDVEIEEAIKGAENREVQDESVVNEVMHEEQEFSVYDFDPEEFQADILTELGEVPPQTHAEEFRMPNLMSNDDYVKLIRSLNTRQRDYLMHTVYNLKNGATEIKHFISGSAGTGKTVLIKALYQSLLLFYNRERGSDPHEMKVLLCAPTGKAAHNIDGMTLHSAFSLPINQAGKKMTDLSADVSNSLAVTFVKTKVLIIDEISMVGAQMLNNLNRRLQDIFRNKNDFGGISIFAFGDFRQLPPVGDRFVFQPSSTDVLGQLLGPPSVLWEKFRIFELTEIMRQRQDVPFANALCHLADGVMSEEEIDLLQSRCYREQDLPDEARNAVRLFNTNAEVDHFNSIALQSINSESAVALAFDSILGSGTQAARNAIMQAALAKKVTETYGLPQSIHFKISARYMMTNNVDTRDGLVNGSAGRLRKIQYGTHKVTQCRVPLRVWIEFDSPRVGVKARTKMRECMERNNIPQSWTPVETITRVIHTRKSSNLNVTRRQFPLVPSEGMTIHKSQGGTYSNIVVQLKERMTRTALYVACSRSTAASGLYLIGNFRAPQPPKATDSTVIEMKRLRETPLIPMFVHLQEAREETQIVFHNVQSFHKHISDVKCDPCFMSSDILLFAEIWTLPQDIMALEGFEQIARMDCQLKRKPFGVAAFIKSCQYNSVSNVKMIQKTQQRPMGHMEAIQFDVNGITITVLYKSPETNLKTLFDTLTGLVTVSKQHIVAGDFNVDLNTRSGQELVQFFASNGLKNIFSFNLSTTDGNTQIDAIFSNVPATGGVYESLFSYHKPIWCKFKFN